MAQGFQQTADGKKPSEIEILDIRNTAVNQRPTLLGVIPRAFGTNGVGMTKEAGADGKYLVAAVDGSKLRIYKSRSSSLIADASFDEVLSTDTFAESGAGLALLTQTDGSIFLLTLNADDDGSNSEACLYQFFDGPTATLSARLARLELPVTDMSASVETLERDKYVVLPVPVLGPALIAVLAIGRNFLNSSFRWGKGVRITSDSTIELYASDRNDLSLSSIPVIGSEQDFSVLVWASTPPTGVPIGHWAGSYSTDTQWWGNYFDFTIGNDGSVVMNGSPLQVQYTAATSTLHWDWQTVNGTTATGTIVFADGANGATVSGNINPRAQDGPVPMTGSAQQGVPIAQWTGSYTTVTTWWGGYFDFTVGADGTVQMQGANLAYRYNPSNSTLTWSWQPVGGTTAMGTIVFSQANDVATIAGTVNPRPQDGAIPIAGSAQV